ncbi:ankyrin repeat domain-containing protein [Rickettsiales endosymbiont of Stachyamoeba lipophora]|uniref:ankyrin repeat domain-containing protein n=1 Tax=Rickettsiales endosymbiont of Stachyamoeba lipophora TaxID=2486578 RepID=UPI000F65312C|nr:ankyrin repeat domain-containing protein [Rickettsiales endosymbiont of Stachyamoeba lipophora]AZL15059.1 ankyrin repeat domain-containing protein [Rickettsiales endosymbiont of Stachyamoeba lipophora]
MHEAIFDFYQSRVKNSSISDKRFISVITRLAKNSTSKIDINMQDLNGNTPLMKAIKNNRYKLVEFLLQSRKLLNLDLNIHNNYGQTALHYLAEKNDYKNLYIIINEISDESLNASYLNAYSSGYSVYAAAISTSSLQVVRLLNHYKRDKFKTQNLKDIITAVNYAVESKEIGEQQVNIISMMQLVIFDIFKEMDANSLDDMGRTMLAQALHCGMDKVAKYLLDNTAIKVNTQNLIDDEETQKAYGHNALTAVVLSPLMSQELQKQFILNLVREKGLNPLECNSNGENIAENALNAGNVEIAKFLLANWPQLNNSKVEDKFLQSRLIENDDYEMTDEDLEEQERSSSDIQTQEEISLLGSKYNEETCDAGSQISNSESNAYPQEKIDWRSRTALRLAENSGLKYLIEERLRTEKRANENSSFLLNC